MESVIAKLQSRQQPIWLLLALSAILALLFSVWAWETMIRQNMGAFDAQIIRFVRQYTMPVLNQFMLFISDIGFGKNYLVMVLAAGSWLLYRRHWPELVLFMATLAGGGVINFILKHLFQRARPEAFRIVDASGYSFPSGHATAAICFFGVMTFLLWRTRTTVWERWLLLAGSSGLVVLIGISRIYLGVHYPSDIIAGYSSGAMWLTFCCAAFLWWQSEQQASKERMIGQ